MNKEYKLLKKYPSLPADWEVGMKVGLGDRCAPISFSPCSGKYKDYYVPYSEVVNSKEYWEEVIEKDYEILFLINKHGDLASYEKGTKLHKEPLQNQYKTKEYFLKCFLQWASLWKIYQVKRISDGEIFTIGDKINFNNLFTATLKEIEYEIAPADKNKGILTFVHDNIVYGKWWKLNQLHKIKDPIFITEDGVEIFDEQLTVFVADISRFATRTKKAINYKNQYSYLSYFKVFSTEQAANEYIKLNKPVLSYNDVMKGYKACKIANTLSGDLINRDNFDQYLTDLVKSKIK